MNDDFDLHTRFDTLRNNEAATPGFRACLAAARSRAEVPNSIPFSIVSMSMAGAAVALLCLALFAFPRPTAPSLSRLPVLLAPDKSGAPLFSLPLLATEVPSDALLPFHLKIHL